MHKQKLKYQPSYFCFETSLLPVYLPVPPSHLYDQKMHSSCAVYNVNRITYYKGKCQLLLIVFFKLAISSLILQPLMQISIFIYMNCLVVMIKKNLGLDQSSSITVQNMAAHFISNRQNNRILLLLNGLWDKWLGKGLSTYVNYGRP